MKKNDTTCYFLNFNGICTAKHGEFCDHNYKHCCFYKTEQQYIEDRNRAIILNRKHGNCEKCKYVAVKCQLIPDKSNDNNGMCSL